MSRSWWIALLVLTAGTGLVVLPVAPAGERYRVPGHLDGLRGPEAAAHYLARRLQLFHWADSLGALTVEGARRGRVLVVGAATDHPDAPAQGRAVAEAAAAALDGTFTQAAVGRFKVDQADGWALEELRAFAGELLLAGRAHGRPYCLSITSLPGEYWRSQAAEGTLWPAVGKDAPPSEALGACWVVARYGLPGPEIARWFSRGGAHFATGHTPYVLKDLVESELDGLAGLYASLDPGRFLTVRAQQCLAGREDACADLVRDPLPSALQPSSVRVPLEAAIVVAEGLDRVAASLPGVLDPAFLASLERRFGQERFRTFWTSDAPLEKAFLDAFGTTPGAYVGQEARTALGPLRPGPGLGAAGWLTLALVSLGGVGVGALVTGRRRVA